MDEIRPVEHKDAVYAALAAAKHAGAVLPPPIKALSVQLGISTGCASKWRREWLKSQPDAFPSYRPYRSRSRSIPGDAG